MGDTYRTAIINAVQVLNAHLVMESDLGRQSPGHPDR